MNGTDQYNLTPVGFRVDGAITFGGSVESSSLTTLLALTGNIPGAFAGTQGYFGPNLRYESATAVPEPGMLMLAGLGIVGLAAARRSRQGRPAPG